MTGQADPHKTQNSPADEGKSGGKPSLDDLLADYGKGDGKGSPTDDSQSNSPSEKDRIAALEERAYRAELNDAMTNQVIPLVKGDLPLPDSFIRSYAVGKAFEDERLGKLFDERAQRPEEFEKAMKALGSELAEEIGKSTGDTSDDDSDDASRTANAVRNARKQTRKSGGEYGDVDWQSLSQGDFETQKRRLFKSIERGELR